MNDHTIQNETPETPEPETANRSRSTDSSAFFTRASVANMIDDFVREHGRRPTKLHLPRDLERDAQRFGRSGSFDSITEFMGLQVVLDADNFCVT